MAYNQELANRIRKMTEAEPLSEKEMFGGIGFFSRGNMTCGVIGTELIVRVGPEAFGDALQRPGARVFDFSGKPMTGWVTVNPEVLQQEADLRFWVNLGTAFAATLPAK